MEAPMYLRILNPLNLNRQISPSFSIFPSNPKPYTAPFKSHLHYRPQINPLILSSNPIFHSQIPNSPKLGFLLSFFSPTHSYNSLKSESNDGKFFHWHKSSTPVRSNGGIQSGKDEVVAVILGWLGARPKHLKRYAEMYNCRGVDAIAFVVPVRDVLWFDLGRKVEIRIRELTNQLVSWLSNDQGRQRRLIFHTFSNTGWLVYGAILSYLQERPDLIEKIGGCIVDSGGDPELNPKVWAAGFAAALLKKRNTVVGTEPKGESNRTESLDEDPHILEAVLLSVLEKLFSYLFKLPDVNQRLSKIISLLSNNQPPCPQLYLYSTADKVIPYRAVESFIEHQKTKGRMVSSFNFGSSPHVDHYRTFPDLYSAQVNNFLTDILAIGRRT